MQPNQKRPKLTKKLTDALQRVVLAYETERLRRERLSEAVAETRAAIEAALSIGYQPSAIAKVLGVKRQSVESRLKTKGTEVT